MCIWVVVCAAILHQWPTDHDEETTVPIPAVMVVMPPTERLMKFHATFI
jgi:hypothetical protein